MIRQTLIKFDLFPAGATLRFRGEPDSINLCTGVFSLLIFMVFTGIFIKMTIDIF